MLTNETTLVHIIINMEGQYRLWLCIVSNSSLELSDQVARILYNISEHYGHFVIQ